MTLSDQEHPRLSGLCERDRLNAGVFQKWLLAWAFSLVVTVLFLGPADTGMASISPFHYSLVLIALTATFFMVRAYQNFFSNADEMIRLLLLKAAARGFGTVYVLGVVFTLGGQLFGEWEDAGTIMWVAGFLTFEISFLREWKKLNAE